MQGHAWADPIFIVGGGEGRGLKIILGVQPLVRTGNRKRHIYIGGGLGGGGGDVAPLHPPFPDPPLRV